MIKLVHVSCICDFDYSKFVDDRGEHVKCELTVSLRIGSEVLSSLIRRVLNYLARSHSEDILRYIDYSVNEVVELKMYADLFRKGLSIYDIISKICLLVDYELYRISSE